MPSSSVAEKARHASQDCINNVNNNEFVAAQLDEGEDESMFPEWEATAVGNLAYIAIHSPSPELRKRASQLMYKHNAWLQQQIRWYEWIPLTALGVMFLAGLFFAAQGI